MGYYTSFSLEFKTDDRIMSCKHNKPSGASFCPECGIAIGTLSLRDVIIEFINKNENMVYALGKNMCGGESCKWYDHQKDLEALSKAFPNVLFTLSGIGEEGGDLWKEYWLGGKVQVAKAKLTYDKFDSSKLSKP